MWKIFYIDKVDIAAISIQSMYAESISFIKYILLKGGLTQMLKKMGGENKELAHVQVLKQSLRAPSIVAGIPAYNEERTIAEVVLKAGVHVGKVLVCDDGSKDMTQKVVLPPAFVLLCCTLYHLKVQLRLRQFFPE